MTVPRQFNGPYGLRNGCRAKFYRHRVSETVIDAVGKAGSIGHSERRTSTRLALVQLLNRGLLQLVGLVRVALILERLHAATPRRCARPLNNVSRRALALARHKHNRRRGCRERVRPIRYAAIAVREPHRPGPIHRHTEPEHDSRIPFLRGIESDAAETPQRARLL